MHVGVGFSETPDTAEAGKHAALEALNKAGRKDPCDLVLLFATARHDAAVLRNAVTSVIGKDVPVVGGGAVGTITNDHYGYAGDQIALAAIWFGKSRATLVVEKDLDKNPVAVGEKIGKRLQQLGVRQETSVALFYDALHRMEGGTRMIMASDLLQGMTQGLGFLPGLVGAGLQGDYINTPTCQWTGEDISIHSAMALVFSGDVRVDHAIMHGCRPATGYYTVTKAERETILEINGQPALEFMQKTLGPEIPPEQYPFFLILGVNHGDPYGVFDEANYASRLCLGINKERSGLVMFEPSLVEGTRFQIMYRSMDLTYMPPTIEKLFTNCENRKPVLALYINCAGRAAGYGGVDIEDAIVLQKIINNRVPLLGIYSGVEIAPVSGIPRGLDWTGVFSLFSVPQ